MAAQVGFSLPWSKISDDTFLPDVATMVYLLDPLLFQSLLWDYRKIPEVSDTLKIAVIILNMEHCDSTIE